MAVVDSVGATPEQHDHEGLADDSEILKQRPMLNVIDVQLEHA
jgi:hypothetical protein